MTGSSHEQYQQLRWIKVDKLTAKPKGFALVDADETLRGISRLWRRKWEMGAVVVASLQDVREARDHHKDSLDAIVYCSPRGFHAGFLPGEKSLFQSLPSNRDMLGIVPRTGPHEAIFVMAAWCPPPVGKLIPVENTLVSGEAMPLDDIGRIFPNGKIV